MDRAATMPDRPITELSDAELSQRPFDELVVDLQQVVQRLEAGNAGLEESIELYKQGLRLHAACEARLKAAELQITELGRRGADAPAGPPPTEG